MPACGGRNSDGQPPGGARSLRGIRRGEWSERYWEGGKGYWEGGKGYWERGKGYWEGGKGYWERGKGYWEREPDTGIPIQWGNEEQM